MSDLKELKTAAECFETASKILSPALEMALAMGTIEGPSNIVNDITRGLEIMQQGLTLRKEVLPVVEEVQEVEKYRPTMHVETLHAWAGDAQKELESLREERKKLRDALGFYGREKTWNGILDVPPSCPLMTDGGITANEALGINSKVEKQLPS